MAEWGHSRQRESQDEERGGGADRSVEGWAENGGPARGDDGLTGWAGGGGERADDDGWKTGDVTPRKNSSARAVPVCRRPCRSELS